MASAQQFIDGADKIYINHGVYIWGGNGEYIEDLRIKDIRIMEENNTENVSRDLLYISNCYHMGYDMKKARAVDCSGLVIAVLRDIGCIGKDEDYRARDLQDMCEKISLKNLRMGDLVFNKETAATHVGIHTGSNIVIESQGRDAGVVRRYLSSGSWVTGGRLPYFK